MLEKLTRKALKNDGYTLVEKVVITFAICMSVAGFSITISNLVTFSESQSMWKWNNEASEKYGNIGDFLGGFIGSLWGFAGVLLFFIALQLQRRTLKSQLDEMENSRELLNKELHSLNLQQYESKFFQFLQLHTQSLSAIKVAVKNEKGEKEYLEGKEFFTYLTEKIYQSFHAANAEGRDECTVFETVYERIYEEYKNTLGQYFRNITLIIKFIDNATELGTDEERNFYMQIIRAQLSNDELLMIAYNGFSDEGRWYTGYVDKYKLLRYLDFELRASEHSPKKMVSAELLVDRYQHLKKVYKEQQKRVEFSS